MKEVKLNKCSPIFGLIITIGSLFGYLLSEGNFAWLVLIALTWIYKIHAEQLSKLDKDIKELKEKING